MKRFGLLSILFLCSIPRFHADDQIAAVQEKLKSRGIFTADNFFPTGRADIKSELRCGPNGPIRDFIAGFVVAGITSDVEPELQFWK
jgi:hypothetical protein